MSTSRIALVIGSLREDSINRHLARAVTALAPPELAFHEVRIGDLPLYNQDDEMSPPESVRRLKEDITSSSGVLFVTPEYNRSIPGVLKNAIDHASRPYGQSAWTGKPAGVMGASVGAPGTSMAQQHLRTILAYLDMPTLGQPEVFIHAKEGLFDAGGHLTNEETRKFLQGWMDRFVIWVRKHPV